MIRQRISSLIVRAMLSMIRFYQRHISSHLGSQCKYMPTCSQYAVESITKYGPVKGLGMAIWRVLRCNPFSRGGYDPVK